MRGRRVLESLAKGEEGGDDGRREAVTAGEEADPGPDLIGFDVAPALDEEPSEVQAGEGGVRGETGREETLLNLSVQPLGGLGVTDLLVDPAFDPGGAERNRRRRGRAVEASRGLELGPGLDGMAGVAEVDGEVVPGREVGAPVPIWVE